MPGEVPVTTPDAREMPRYTIPEIALYVRAKQPTLETWIRGYSSHRPLIRRPVEGDPRLSYHNLVEAYVLDVLRRRMLIPLQTIRRGIELARQRHGIDRLLLSHRLRARRGNILLEVMGGYENIGRHGQQEIPEVVRSYLHRIEYRNGLPVRLYPVTRTDDPDSPRRVVILPDVGFGRPVTERKLISTAVISDRFNAGESVGDLADDYDLSPEDVEEAIRAERSPLAA
jgi:uncharacterized protein (DUF433 family)